MAAVILAAIAIKVASAFVPAPLLLSPPVITTATGAALSTWSAIAGGIGALLYSVGLRDGGGNEFMHVRVNPNAPAEVPGGWSSAPNPANDPVPPSTAGAPTPKWRLFNYPGPSAGQWFNSKNDACSTAAAENKCVRWEIVADGGGTERCYGYATQQGGGCGVGGFTFQTQDFCPTGYTNSGGTCTLSQSTQVRYPANNRCGLRISGGVMTYDSRDPDCDGPPTGVLSPDGKTLQVTAGANRVQVKVNTDGTVSVTQWTANPNGTTTINGAKAGDPASATSSQVESSSQSTTTATGEDAFAQEPSGQPSSGFPDDYARDATVATGNQLQQQANAKLDEIKEQLTTDGVEPGDPVAKEQSDIESVFFNGAFDALKGWTMPARAVACPTWSFDLWGQTYTINAHCALIEDQRALVSTICLLAYALLALFIVLGA